MKYSLPDIKKGFGRITFKDEGHRTNYALKIIKENMNTAYKKIQNMEKAEEKTNSIDLSIVEHKGAEYITSNLNTPKRLKDLW